MLLGLFLCLIAWRLETPWRRVQAAYFDQLLNSSRAELAVLQAQQAEDLRFLEGELQVARDQLASRADEVSQAEDRMLALERKLRAADSRREREAYREQADLQRRRVESLYSGVRAAEDALAEARRPIEILETRIDSLGGMGGRLRRVPVLRAVGAGIGLRLLTPTAAPDGSPGFAASSTRPERCMTCHLATTEGVEVLDETWGRLWAPHPSPDLFLREDSLHPVTAFGCTSCHGGDGMSTDFALAGHRPADEETEARWRRAFNWRSVTRSQAPRSIRAGVAVESSCVRCHDAPGLRGAPVQEAGRRLARSMACDACHETGRPDLEPSVPSLVGLPLRKRPEWVAAFLADPSAWKATFMPHFWSGAAVEERDVEIAAVVAWFWQESGSSESPDPKEAPAQEGSEDKELVATGGRIFRDLACGACHLIARDAPRGAFLHGERLRGPDLALLGSEARAGALASLLEGHQPAFRWRVGEVPRLSAFLQTRRAASDPVAPAVDAEVRDRLLRRRLLDLTSTEDADARMNALDGEGRVLLLGELAIRRYRCDSCHRLPQVPLDIEVPERLSTVEAPSLADIGRRVSGGAAVLSGWPHSLAEKDGTLPVWQLDAREAEALEVQLAGWRKPNPARGIPADRGRDVMARVGCAACHDLDGRGPTEFFAQRLGGGGLPPSLARAGEKLRADWIFRHLGDPSSTALRPWTGLRMPRFDLSADARSEIAEFFASRAGVALLSPEPEPSSPAERALGAAVYDVLFCGGCHADAEEGRTHLQRAPSYARSRTRLRADWLRRWLLDPLSWQDVPSMPPPFPLRDGKPDASYLPATLEAPMFEIQRRRLERFFAGQEEFGAALEDARRVADALAAHLLAMEEEEGAAQ